jgi:hypothetical protein
MVGYQISMMLSIKSLKQSMGYQKHLYDYLMEKLQFQAITAKEETFY